MIATSTQSSPAWPALEAMRHEPVHSDWLHIDQDRISAFAEVTGDNYFIHVSPERAAAETPFGGTIAHGLLTLSLIPLFWAQSRPPFPKMLLEVNYGYEAVRFVAPVLCGQRVRGSFTMREARRRKPGEYLVRYAVVIEIAGASRPAVVADWKVLYRLSPDARWEAAL